MGIFRNPPPQQLAAGRQPLDTREGVPTQVLSQVGDFPPFSLAWLNGALAWFGHEASPVFARPFIVQGAAAPAVDSPTPNARSSANLSTILATWREVSQVPQLRALIVQPGAAAAADQPEAPAAALGVALAAWNADAAPIQQQRRFLVQPRTGDDPAPRDSARLAALLRGAWEAQAYALPSLVRIAALIPAPAPAADDPPRRGAGLGAILQVWQQGAQDVPRAARVAPLVGAPQVDNPPARSTLPPAILRAWDAPAPAPRPAPQVAALLAPPVDAPPPRATLPAALLRAWDAADVRVQRGAVGVPFLVAPADNPPAERLQVPLEVRAWSAPAFVLPQRPAVLPIVVPPDAPPPRRRDQFEALRAAWEPAAPLPTIPRRSASVIPPPPPPPVNDPPFDGRTLRARAALVGSWQIVAPYALVRFEITDGRTAEVWTPQGITTHPIGQTAGAARGAGLGARQGAAKSRGIGNNTATPRTRGIGSKKG